MGGKPVGYLQGWPRSWTRHLPRTTPASGQNGIWTWVTALKSSALNHSAILPPQSNSIGPFTFGYNVLHVTKFKAVTSQVLQSCNNDNDDDNEYQMIMMMMVTVIICLAGKVRQWSCEALRLFSWSCVQAKRTSL